MRKIYNLFIGLLAVAVILTCAFLPTIYAYVSDLATDEKVEYEEIKQVSFDTEMNLIEKLFLLRDGLRIEVPDTNTMHTEEEIITLSYEPVYRYYDMGMINLEIEEAQIKAEPMFFCYNDQVDDSNMFWMIQYIWQGTATLSMWFDDETEMPLAIDYSSDLPVYDKFMMLEILEYLYTYYMEYTDLVQWNTESEEEPEEMNMSELYPSMETKKLGIEMDSRIGDVLYGELTIRFSVNSNGFAVDVV